MKTKLRTLGLVIVSTIGMVWLWQSPVATRTSRTGGEEAAETAPARARPVPDILPARTDNSPVPDEVGPASAPAGGPWTADRYERAGMLAERWLADPKDDSRRTRLRLVRTDCKYPLLRVEDSLVAKDGQWRLVGQVASVADHVVIEPLAGVTEDEIARQLGHLGARVRKRMPASGIWLVAFPEATLDTVPQAVAEIARIGSLASVAEPDYIVHASVMPNDASFPSLWGLHNTGQGGGTADADIDAPEAWDRHTGSRSVCVAVIDSGVDYNHPDLAANIWTNPGETAGNGVDDDGNGYVDDVRGWNFVSETNNPMDDNRHGTHCAGTIGGVGNNGTGVAGVCWQVAIMPLKFLSSTGSGATSDATEAVAYATAKGIWLTSNSWGGGGFSQTLKNVIDAANAAGVLFVAAAGNDAANNDTSASYPANYDCPNIISVASTTRTDTLSSFSNYGVTKVHLGAPGSEIYSTTPGNTYATLSGTSMATPHVSGACALLKAANPGISHTLAKDIIMGSTDAVAALTGACVTGGRLNVNNALDLANDMLITPTVRFVATGPVGGPFTPGSVTYTLSNLAAAPANWTVTGAPAWITLSGTGGTLAAGGSAAVTATVNAASLADGIHNATLVFTNTTTAMTQSRSVQLRVGLPDYFTELFGDTPNDTDNRLFAFTPNGSSSYYGARQGAAVAFGTDPAGGSLLSLGDDDSALVTLTGGAQVALYGTTHSSFYVGSNGYVTFGSGDSAYNASLSSHFAKPRIAGLFDDLNPSSGGTVSWRQLADRVAVTFQNVVNYATTTANSFQIEMFFDGRIHITTLGIGSSGGLIGLSQGLGVPEGFSESDFTAFPPLVPLVPGPEIAVEQPVGVGLVDGTASVNFGNRATGFSNSLTFTIRSAGLDALTGLSASIDGSNAGDFSVTTAPPSTLASGAGATFVVRFQPAALGTRTANLHLTSNDADESPFDITLTGLGVPPAPEIVVEQPAGTPLVDGSSTVGWGTVAVSRDAVLNFTVNNTGTADLTDLGVAVTGAHADEFTVTASPAAAVPPGGGTAFAVRFAPTAAGPRSAALSISSNDSDEHPFDIGLSGAGVVPLAEMADDFDAEIDATMWDGFGGTVAANTHGQAAGPGSTGNSLHFDGSGSRFATTQWIDARTGGGVSFLLAMANGLSSPWETADSGDRAVLEYSLDGKTFVQFGGPYGNVSWERTVVAIPAAARTAATQFRFRQLANSGSGYDHWAIDDVRIGASVALAPEIALEQPAGTSLLDGSSSVSFGSAAVGTNASLTFTVLNRGAANLTGLAATVDGTNAGDFTVTTQPAATVAPGDTTTFVVSFAPAATGSRTAALHIANNDADENPFDIALSGTGTVLITLANALDQPTWTFTNSGSLPWTGQNATTHDGVDAARSGAITHSQSSEMSTTVTGPGAVSFWWKVSSESDYDYLRFSIDGVEQSGSISGTVDWTHKTYNIPPGSHTLKWTYSKDGSASSGSDCGWVDQVVLGPPVPEIAVEQPAGTNLTDGTSTAAFSAPTGGTASLTFTVRNTGGANLTGLAATVGGTHASDFTVTSQPAATVAPGSTTTFVVRFSPTAAGVRTAALHLASNDADENPFDIALIGTRTVALAEALDLPTRTFTNSGNLPWIGQDSITHDGVDAGRSGAITHSQTSEMSTTVGGPGTVSFWWKVSSESGYDYLRFSIDGVEQSGTISGEVDWTQKTYHLSAGLHTLKWSYTKDSSDNSGSDCGWVDQLVLSGSDPEITVEQPAGTGLTDGVSAVEFSAPAGGSSSLTFTVRNIGGANLTGLAATIDGAHASDFTITTQPAATVVPGSTATFVVRFSPASAGWRAAALHLASNDGDENPFDISLIGTRISPVVIQDPSFDNRYLDQGRWTNTLTPWQETNGPDSPNGFIEHISGFAADGANHLGMALNHNVWQDLGITYQANTRYTLTVAAGNRGGQTQAGNQSRYLLAGSTGTTYATGSFNASTLAVGTFADAPPLVFETGSSSPAIGRSIRILLQAGGAGRSHFDRIRLTATPVSPEILIEQPVGTSLADGTSTATLFAPVNGTASLTFTVRNAGNAALTGLAATVDGADASDFAITTQPAATVAPGGTTTVAVRFSATATGSRVAALHLASNDADENPFDIALSGTGFMPTPGITVEQPAGSGLTDGGSSPFFGAVALGANASRTFTVRNTGASPLLALGAMIDGPNAGDFTLVTPPAALVEVGGVTTLVVRFSPAATGQRRAALHLTYTGGTNPFDITLGGLGGTATTASLHHASRGWYDADGASNAPGTNFATGFSAAGNREVRSFFSFNLPALAAGERFVAAELRLTNPSNGFASSDAWETLRISEVVTPSATLGAGTGGQAVFADLADGPVFGGPTEVSGASNGTTVVIPLNAAFLSQANTRASQQIALGCSLGTLRAVAGVSETIFGSTTSTHTTTLVITKAANNPPMFSGYTLATPYQTPAVIPIRKLLAKASDPDGDMLTVSAADAVSAHGGSVAVRTDSLLYTPAAGRFGADSFGVTISDGRGGTVTGTVTTTIGQAPGAGGIGSNSPVLATLPDGKIGISFQGIPGRTYTVQRSAGGLDDWVTLAIITADAAGRVSFTDESPPPGSGFYRLGVP